MKEIYQIKINNKNQNKKTNENNNNPKIKAKNFLGIKRKHQKEITSLESLKNPIIIYNSKNNQKFQEKKPIDENLLDNDDNDLYEEKKTTKKKESKKNNILGGKMNSILGIGELLLNLLNNEELSQLMNKKIVYFKQKIEKKEKEILFLKKLKKEK